MRILLASALLLALSAPALAHDRYRGGVYYYHPHRGHHYGWRPPVYEEWRPIPPRPWAWHRRWRGCNPAMYPGGICDEE